MPVEAGDNTENPEITLEKKRELKQFLLNVRKEIVLKAEELNVSLSYVWKLVLILMFFTTGIEFDDDEMRQIGEEMKNTEIDPIIPEPKSPEEWTRLHAQFKEILALVDQFVQKQS